MSDPGKSQSYNIPPEKSIKKQEFDNMDAGGRNLNTDRLETEAPMMTDPGTAREQKLLGLAPSFQNLDVR